MNVFKIYHKINMMRVMIDRLRRRPTHAVLCLLMLFIFGYLLLRVLFNTRNISFPSQRMEFSINKLWDGQPVNHEEILIRFSATEAGLKMTVDAPLFNDPPNPGTKPGEPLFGLWNYEVVEAFFLNDKKQYLEVELCPHGQHVVLMLNDTHKVFNQLLPLHYEAKIDGTDWHGQAIIPWDYFPPKLTKFNAYAIHGTEPRRMYEALYPVPKDTFETPDFHRLEYFRAINFDDVWPRTDSGQLIAIASPFWH